jgi:FkbM family methyltransferase
MNINSLFNLIKSNNILYFLAYPIIYIRRLILKVQYNLFDKYYNKIFSIVKEGSLVVDISDFEGLFEMDSRSNFLRLIFKYQSYEKEIVDIVRKHINPTRDVIDVGANIGLYSILFSKLIFKDHRVLCIEPSPAAIKYLRKNIERNNSVNTIIYEGIATKTKGYYKFNIIPGMEEYSSLGPITHRWTDGKKYESIDVSGDTIDNLVINYNLNPGFIKVDVEGAEYLVFSGARETIKKYRPIILSELSDNMMTNLGNSSEDVIQMLRECNYEIINALNVNISIRSPFNGNILAIPS